MEAQAALTRWLDRNPAMWRQIGDLAHHSQAELIRLVGKSDFVFTESIKRRMAEQRAELLGVFPTPLETLAVDRLIAARMYLEHVEAQCTKAEDEIPVAKFWLARQRQAHNLYHCAVKSLLLVRELLPAAAPPAALGANDKGRFDGALNGNRASPGQSTAAVPANRINGMKNGRGGRWRRHEPSAALPDCLASSASFAHATSSISRMVCSKRGRPPNCIPNRWSLSVTISCLGAVRLPGISARLPHWALAISATS